MHHIEPPTAFKDCSCDVIGKNHSTKTPSNECIDKFVRLLNEVFFQSVEKKTKAILYSLLGFFTLLCSNL